MHRFINNLRKTHPNRFDLSIATYYTYKSHVLATTSSHHIASQRKHKKEYHINLETINM